MTSREYFWGAELSSEDKKKQITWDPEEDEDDDDEDAGAIQHFLFLKHAVLGPKAKPGERSVVEIKAEDFDGNLISQPLFSLKEGLNECTILDIGAQPPITLSLVSGSGPVYISGQHALELKDDDFGMEDFEDSEADESPIKAKSQVKMVNGGKRPAAGGGPSPKKAKLEQESSKKTPSGKEDKKRSSKDEAKKAIAQDEEEDDDEEDDEDFDMDAEEEGDEDDEDEDDESDEDDDEEDEDEDDEEDEEEEEKEKKAEEPAQKTPKKEAVQKEEGKKAGKGKGGEKKQLSLDEIKLAIQKSPAKPKKQNKFQNYVRSHYKLTDEKTVAKLWEWYRDTQLKN